MAKEMKDSGIEWIGEIPIDWKIIPIKYLTSYNDEVLGESTDLEYEFDYIEIGSVEYGKGITQVERLKFANAPSRARRIVRPNDIIVSTVRTYLRTIATVHDSDVVQIASTGFVVIRAKSINPEYLRYSILSESFISMVEAYSTGISYPAINPSVVVGFKIPVPCNKEQKRIALFLNEQCGELDNILSKTRTSIEEYKKLKQAVITRAVTQGVRNDREMKNSIVEWIEKIPIDWKEQRIKTLFDLRDEKNYLPLEEVNLISLYTDLGVVQHSELEKTTGNKATNADGYKIVCENDIVVNIILCWMGAIGCSAYNGVTSPAYDIYVPRSGVDSRFYHYYFRTKGFSGDCYKRGKGIMAMRWRTYSEQFRDICVVYPPLGEQIEIVNYLDEKCAEIDNLIAKKQHYLAEIENYKKSLIYEYVTGKKEV